MKVYTYSEARQQLARLLDESKAEGEVRIRRRDGTVFAVTEVRQVGSPLDVPGVDVSISRQEILDAIAASRER